MNDRIIYKEEVYKDAAARLDGVQRAAGLVYHGLMGIDSSGECFSSIRVNTPAGSGSIGEVLRQAGRSAKQLEARVKQTMEGISKACANFEAAERTQQVTKSSDPAKKYREKSSGSTEALVENAMLSYAVYGMDEWIRKKLENPEAYPDFQVEICDKGVYRIRGKLPGSDREVNGLYFSQKESGHTDCYVGIETDADGKSVIKVAFEGTQGLRDILTDAVVAANKDGVHTGFAYMSKDFIKNVLGSDYPIHCEIDGVEGDYSVRELMDYAGRNKDVTLSITGHSFGGAQAQVTAYYILKDNVSGISKEQIEVTTFASPIPFTKDAVKDPRYRDMNVTNYIHSQDKVTDIGVVDSPNLPNQIRDTAGKLGKGLHREVTGKTVNGGYSHNSTNLGKNVYFDTKDFEFNPATTHSMKKTYLKYANEASQGKYKGDVQVVDTDSFYR